MMKKKKKEIMVVVVVIARLSWKVEKRMKRDHLRSFFLTFLGSCCKDML